MSARKLRWIVGVSAALFVLTGCLWLYSQCYFFIRSFHGNLYLIIPSDTFYVQYVNGNFSMAQDPISLYPMPNTVVHSFLGFSYAAQQLQTVIGVPILALTLIPMTTGAIGLIFLKRRCARAAGGYCVNCGYDLRHSSERCPECGTAVVKPQPARS